jgi:hypothetical protein
MAEKENVLRRFRFTGKYVVPLATAALAFIGAILGTYLTSSMDQANWEARFELERRRAILEKRIEMMGSVAALLAQRPVIEGLSGNIEASLARISIRSNCIKAGGASCGESSDDLGLVERSSKERNAIASKLHSELMLSSVYFGPKTRKAVNELGNPWTANDVKLQGLTQTMADELNYFGEDP